MPACAVPSLTTQDDIDAGKNQIQLSLGQLPNFFYQQFAIESNDLRDIRNGVFRKTCRSGKKKYVTGGFGPAKIAGQRNADNRPQSAPIKRVPLDN